MERNPKKPLKKGVTDKAINFQLHS